MQRIASELAVGICLSAIWYYFAEFAFRPYQDTPGKAVMTWLAFSIFLSLAARLGAVIASKK